MDGLAPQLSTIGSTLDQLTDRITALADDLAGRAGGEGPSAELYEIERTLQHASRRLQRLVERS